MEIFEQKYSTKNFRKIAQEIEKFDHKLKI